MSMNLGTIIRRYRKNNKLTLKVVADRAGISEGFLSQIENNVNSPSVDTLMNICSAIGINASELLTQVENQEKSVIIRKSEWEDVDFPKSGFVTRRFFPPESREVIDSAVIMIEPGRSIPVRKNVKNCQEVIAVLKGRVILTHGDADHELKEGDSIHYRTEPERQKVYNNSGSCSIILWVGTI